MDDMRDLARDPKVRREFEKLLYLAARRGDADLVAERLSWGIDPNCTSSSDLTTCATWLGTRRSDASSRSCYTWPPGAETPTSWPSGSRGASTPIARPR